MNWEHLWLAISVFVFFDALLGVYEMSRDSKVKEMVCCSFIGVAALYFAIGFAVEIFK